jgi:hypothetical protein
MLLTESPRLSDTWYTTANSLCLREFQNKTEFEKQNQSWQQNKSYSSDKVLISRISRELKKQPPKDQHPNEEIGT